MIVRDLISNRWLELDVATRRWLTRLLRSEGVNIGTDCAADLVRGTPVYVVGDEDATKVQRIMAQHHIRSLLVVDNDDILGTVDLLDFAIHSEEVPTVSERSSTR